MIEELDEFLKKFLISELATLGYDPAKVDIVFEQPKREWSARISRPTLNMFLYDIRENQKLRQTQPAWETRQGENGRAEQRRKPVRIDLHYLITAWGTAPEDEHSLLSRTMMALLRYSSLPEEIHESPPAGKNHEGVTYLPEILRHSGKPIPILIAQYEELPNPTDIWNVLDNEMRPAIMCILTIPVDPYAPVTVPLVRTRELVVGESPEPASGQFRKQVEVKPRSLQEAKDLELMKKFRQGAGLEPAASSESLWTIGGTLTSEKPVDFGQVRLTVVELGVVIPVQPDGRFIIGRLREGKYALEVAVDGGQTQRFSIEVPSADFELKL